MAALLVSLKQHSYHFNYNFACLGSRYAIGMQQVLLHKIIAAPFREELSQKVAACCKCDAGLSNAAVATVRIGFFHYEI